MHHNSIDWTLQASELILCSIWAFQHAMLQCREYRKSTTELRNDILPDMETSPNPRSYHSEVPV